MRNAHLRPAAVLILVLWAVAILSLLAGGLTYALRQDQAVANIEKDRVIAHYLARAGVERAIAELMEDISPTDTLNDSWYDNQDLFQTVKLTGGTFSVYHDDLEDSPSAVYGAADESAKLNVNAATREQLMRLPKMTESIAGAILDWRDANEEPEPDGAEGGYYAALQHPYKIRNGPLRTLRELLLVRDVTPDLLYGEDTNGNGLLDANENDGATGEPDDNADGTLDRGWFAYLTVHTYEKNVDAKGAKRLNIKTARAEEMSQRLRLESWAAQSIIKVREQKQFEHLVDMLKVRRDPSIKAGSEPDNYQRGESEKDQPVTTTIFKEILDQITLSDEDVLPGRVNINTAPHAVLKTLPGVEDELADAIIRNRNVGDGFTSIGQLLNVQGVNTEMFAKLEDAVTVRSNVFRIQATGQTSSGLARAAIECIVDRGGAAPRVLYWLESSP